VETGAEHSVMPSLHLSLYGESVQKTSRTAENWHRKGKRAKNQPHCGERVMSLVDDCIVLHSRAKLNAHHSCALHIFTVEIAKVPRTVKRGGLLMCISPPAWSVVVFFLRAVAVGACRRCRLTVQGTIVTWRSRAGLSSLYSMYIAARPIKALDFLL
jgi:hypothetical protein